MKVNINGKDILEITRTNGDVALNINGSLKKFDDHAAKVSWFYAGAGFGVAQLGCMVYNEFVQAMAPFGLGMEPIPIMKAVGASMIVGAVAGAWPVLMAGLDIVTGLRKYQEVKTVAKYITK